MRRPNLSRMRKVNMAALLADYPPRYVLGLPTDGEIPDFTPGEMWTLPDRDVHTGPLNKAQQLDRAIKRYQARKAWGFPA